MEFRKEVQEQFAKAGWKKDRSVQDKFDALPRFNEFPQFLKDFLYEYGDLEVETLTKYAKGSLNTKALLLGYADISASLDEDAGFGENLKVFPIAYYPLDNASMVCDAEGKVYMESDFPALMSNNFKEGIEKVIMEDYSDTLKWDEEDKKWVEDDF